MLLTLLLSVILMAAMFVMLYAAVGLIQDKRLFSTAPRDIQAAVIYHPERFHHAHELGWKLVTICVLMIIGVFLYGAYDGARNGYSYWQHFCRFLVILYLWKAFDIICFDWLLLTKSRFFQYFYPETAGCAGYHQFGFNWKGQLIRIAIFPMIAALLAAVAVRMVT